MLSKNKNGKMYVYYCPHVDTCTQTFTYRLGNSMRTGNIAVTIMGKYPPATQDTYLSLAGGQEGFLEEVAF